MPSVPARINGRQLSVRGATKVKRVTVTAHFVALPAHGKTAARAGQLGKNRAQLHFAGRRQTCQRN